MFVRDSPPARDKEDLSLILRRMGPPMVGVGGCSMGERTAAETSAATGSMGGALDTGGGGACGCGRLLFCWCNLAMDTGDGFCCNTRAGKREFNIFPLGER